MSVRNDVSITWSVSPRIIEVSKEGTSPTEITAQDLYDTVRNLAAQVAAMAEDDIIDAGGKEVLSESLLVGLTVKLKNAKVKFEDRPEPTYIQCQVSGGNLVAVDGTGESMSPIQPSSYTQVILAQSSSATLVAGAMQDKVTMKSLFDIAGSLLGPKQENQCIDNIEYDEDGNIIRFRIQSYINPRRIGADDNISSCYTILATYSDGLMTSYNVLKDR